MSEWLDASSLAERQMNVGADRALMFRWPRGAAWA